MIRSFFHSRKGFPDTIDYSDKKVLAILLFHWQEFPTFCHGEPHRISRRNNSPFPAAAAVPENYLVFPISEPAEPEFCTLRKLLLSLREVCRLLPLKLKIITSLIQIFVLQSMSDPERQGNHALDS